MKRRRRPTAARSGFAVDACPLDSSSAKRLTLPCASPRENPATAHSHQHHIRTLASGRMPHASHRHLPPAGASAVGSNADASRPDNGSSSIAKAPAPADPHSTVEQRHNASRSPVRPPKQLHLSGANQMPNRTRAPRGDPAVPAHLGSTERTAPVTQSVPSHGLTVSAQDPALHQPITHHSYYPPSSPYVHTHRDTTSGHFIHTQQQNWPAQPSTAYPWHPQQQPQQHHQQQLHQQSLQPLPHPTFKYQIGHGVQHVAMGPPQYSHVQPPVWAIMQPHTNHSQYPSHLPVQMHDVPQSHYAQYYPPQSHVVHYSPHSTLQATAQRNGMVSGAPKYSDHVDKPSENKDPPMNVPRTVNTSATAKSRATPMADAAPHDSDVQNNRSSREPSNVSKERSPAAAPHRENGNHASKSNDQPSRSSQEHTPQRREKSTKQGGSKGSSANESTSNVLPGKQGHQQPIRKSRKPYTLTKHRECWSDKEHQRFLQALQLYNRDWKRVEQFIGTKTVHQIRSHAQKYFEKVSKYKTGEYIPPPRPKRRASRPYPRSRNTASSTARPSANTSESLSSKPMENNTATSGSGNVRDSGAGSSDNGHVSGNGKSMSNGSSECDGNKARDRLSSRQRSVDRTSAPFPNVPEERDHIGRNTVGGNTATDPKRAENSPQRPTPLNAPPQQACMAGNYDPYYYNVVRPDSLSYAPGFYQNNYYSPLRHQPPPTLYPCYDRNCTQYNAYHSHTMTHGGVPLHHMALQRETDSHGCPIRHHPVALGHGSAEQSHAPSREHNMVGQLQSSHMFPSAAVAQHDQAQQVKSDKKGNYPSLVVLSNCVNMMDKNNQHPIRPLTGWPEVAAMRRAHRARIIRGRKSQTQKAERSDGVRRGGDGENDSSEGKRGSNGATAEPVPQPKGDTDILISPFGSGANSTGVMDAGSDEAVAGFSGSDGQGSMSDVAHNNGGPDSSDNPEEDPNSSNEGSGDDGRGQNGIRGSSPTDPNSGGSAGSREDTPSAPDTVDSQNVTPTGASRESTPHGNTTATAAAAGASSVANTAAQNSSPKTGVDDTVMVAAKVLSKYRRGNVPGPPVSSSSSRKAGIDNLLNRTPTPDLYALPRQPQVDQKRARCTPERKSRSNLVRNGCTGTYDGEPESQRRKHSAAQP